VVDGQGAGVGGAKSPSRDEASESLVSTETCAFLSVSSSADTFGLSASIWTTDFFAGLLTVYCFRVYALCFQHSNSHLTETTDCLWFVCVWARKAGPRKPL